MRITSRIGLAASLVGVQVMVGAGVALASINGQNSQDGAQISVTTIVLDRARNGLDLQTGEPDPRTFAYTSAIACQFSTPGGANADVPRAGAVQACAGNTPARGQGPQVRLYRRELGANGTPISPA